MGALSVRTVVGAALGVVAVVGGAQLLARRLSVGDADSDEFTLATFFFGAERASSAPSLRRGRVMACFAGVDLDLREATLDSNGAQLVVQAGMAGVQVTVRDDWRVTVDADAKAAGVETRLASPEALPEDAPTLHVDLKARMSGVLVTTGDITATDASDASG